MTRVLRTPSLPSLAQAAVALIAVAVVLGADGWRGALVAAVAGGAVLATRLRFAVPLATVLLSAVAAGVVLAGGS
jgi:uncharacterized membrane protein YjjP (DUF1212 family)